MTYLNIIIQDIFNRTIIDYGKLIEPNYKFKKILKFYNLKHMHNAHNR